VRPFESSAQNFEDVVLWRVLHDVERGCYVDVGACEPVVGSISWSFYEQGWRGALVEPVPASAAALRRRRPDDVTIEAAAGATDGAATLYLSDPVGNSTLSREVAVRAAGSGTELSEVVVRVAKLDDLLEEAGLSGRTIHFCTIDVEGAEADVLAGFDLARWRPWILVVEATEPNRPEPSHERWEGGVLAAGYRFCLFDGLNRFYVHREKADAFAARLSYPACMFDEAFARAMATRQHVKELERTTAEVTRRADELQRRADELERVAVEATRRADELDRLAARASWLEHEKADLARRLGEVQTELAAMQETISWRVTRPLRAAREAQRRLGPQGTTRETRAESQAPIDRELEASFARRLAQAAETLWPDVEGGPRPEVEDALAALEAALASSPAPHAAKAWLALVAADGSYPGERAVERVARKLRMDGPGSVRGELLERLVRSAAEGRASTADLDVRRGRVVVDVTHTVSSDLHTGVQRVVRETVARWIHAGQPLELMCLDLDVPAGRLLADEEYERLGNWRDHLASGAVIADRVPQTAGQSTLVPWQCRLVVPELPAEPERARAYRALATSSVLRSLSLVGYDLIPIVAAETVATATTVSNFGEYLSLVKHVDRIAAISRTSADGFRAFVAMTSAEGLGAPVVEAHELPAEAPELEPTAVELARSRLGIGAKPLVLAVGSHEPRKNHTIVLEAAERLWAERGDAFQCLFIGGSSWQSEEFDHLVDRLLEQGRPIAVRRRCTEAELWAAYRLARFTVFPSLLEGYGLPIRESLASGTPVITSSYGSMAEVGSRGGCLLVDPRNVDELERAMRRLLDDNDALAKLRDEALALDTATWERYADDVWSFLTEVGEAHRDAARPSPVAT
jgi:FkbM family methyltransferase